MYLVCLVVQLLTKNICAFNLEDDSIFRNLRIMTFRKKIKDLNFDNKNISSEIIDQVDKINKKENINLVVINFVFKRSLKRLRNI